MGLFGFKKKNNKVNETQAPSGMIAYRGGFVYQYVDEENLPDQLHELLKMINYYTHNELDENKRDKIIKSIVLKANEMVKSDKEKDPGWVKAFMVDLFGSEKDKIEYYFKCFISDISQVLLTQDDKDKRDALSQHEWYPIVKEKELLNKRLVRNNFTYREDYYGNKKKIFDNKMVLYYENQMYDIIDVIMRLVNNEKSGQYISYIGYYMYKDLKHYFDECEREKKHFDFSLWQNADEYLKLMYKNYDLTPASKESKAKFTEMQNEAKNNIAMLTRGKLVDSYHKWDDVIHQSLLHQITHDDEFSDFIDDQSYSIDDEDKIIEMMEKKEREALNK